MQIVFFKVSKNSQVKGLRVLKPDMERSEALQKLDLVMCSTSHPSASSIVLL